MKLLALDTATEQCSVALYFDHVCITREVQTARGHADIILSMVQEVLAESGITMNQLDAIGFGRGPGGFTGVRIAVGVAQGLAFACDIPVVGVSNLAAVAQQAPPSNDEVLVCMDARMAEVYWGRFRFAEDGLVVSTSVEQVSAPENVIELYRSAQGVLPAALGTGFNAYPALREYFHKNVIDSATLPRASDIAKLALRDFDLGLAVAASEAQPAYVRDQVAHISNK